MDAARRALVTGGASGFGLAIARQLLERDTRVALLDIDPGGLAAAVESDGRLVGLEGDVRSKSDVEAAVRAATRELGGLDTVVASAGVLHRATLAEASEADWNNTIDVNLKGAFLVSQAAAPALETSGRGRIVIVASDAGRVGYPFAHAYCASKFGVVGLAQSLAAELAGAQITVNCVCPSACPTTSMGQRMLDLHAAETGRSVRSVLDGLVAAHPVGRVASEADVAGAVAYLVSEEASFVTGTSLDVDGGLHLGR